MNYLLNMKINEYTLYKQNNNNVKESIDRYQILFIKLKLNIKLFNSSFN